MLFVEISFVVGELVVGQSDHTNNNNSAMPQLVVPESPPIKDYSRWKLVRKNVVIIIYILDEIIASSMI